MPYVLGVDGGGTRTQALVVDEAGQVLGQGQAGPGNYRVVGSYRAGAAIVGAVLEAFGQTPLSQEEITQAFLGLAGVDREADRRMIEKALEGFNFKIPARFDNDMVIALTGAIREGWGLVVNAGTGAIAFGINPRGERGRADGWGFLLGDEGSGYDLGRRALMAVLRATDGRGPRTRLEEKIRAALHLTQVEELLTVGYERLRQPEQMAALAPLVLEVAQEGDGVATGLVEEAAQALLRSARAVVERLGLGIRAFKIVLAGGLLPEGSPLRARLMALLHEALPHGTVIPPLLPPVGGAVILAAREAGLEVSGEFLETLKQGLSPG